MASSANTAVENLHIVDTIYSADSVEWCPALGHQHILGCGTYQLEEQSSDEHDEPRKRIGRLLLYSLERDGTSTRLCEHQVQEVPAILDMKWNNCAAGSNALLGVADAKGDVCMYRLTEDCNRPTFTLADSVRITDNALILSLEWARTSSSTTTSSLLTTSDSKGNISLIQALETGYEVLNQWKGHDFEAWIAAFNQWNIHNILSGGDDCLLKMWDTRTPPVCSVLTSRKHSAGVCSAQSSPLREHILVTGSYDETVILWDARKMVCPLATVSTGGGVWRLKWHPTLLDHLVTASMHNGFHVLKMDTANDCTVTASYTEHGSLAYGVDWCRLQLDQLPDSEEKQETTQSDTKSDKALDQTALNKDIVASCSFYDHSLHIWSYNTESSND